jgi:exopolysaccharide biosynthesis polyprenyl glycosylphosphotransferase
MLKEQAKLFNRITVLIDITVIVVSLLLAYHVRSAYSGYLRPLVSYLWVLAFVVPAWCLLLNKYGLFSSIRKLTAFEVLTRVFNVHLFGGFICAAAIYFFDKDMYSRGLYLGFVAISFALMATEKLLLRLMLGYARRRGYNTRFLLIVGARDKAGRFKELVESHADWGLKIVGFVLVDKTNRGEHFLGYPILGELENLVDICKERPIDEVIFCVPKGFVVDAEAYLGELESLGVTVRMVLDFYDMPMYRKEISYFHEDIPILTYHAKAFDAQQLFLKRMLDIVGALLGLLLLVVLYPFIAVAIKLDSPGPILFRQKRVGYNGRIFTCRKFRSMVASAEKQKQELADRNEMNGALFKIRDDPRVTRVGRFLRRTSLDEFPQFWNVLVGEMSLVGTRPPTRDEVEQYENWHRRRISIKPGLTGLWQVSGRSHINTFDDVVKLDLAYIDSWSLWLDLKVILKTIYVVLSRSGSF